MDTVIVTLKLPTDLYSLVKKYAKAFIINEQFSNSYASKNTSVLTSSLLENPQERKTPTLDDVVEEVRRTGSNISPERFVTYYEERKWLGKDGKPFDWKKMLAKWGTYNLETTKQPSKNTVAKCDFSNDNSFKSAVADLIAENKKEEVA